MLMCLAAISWIFLLKYEWHLFAVLTNIFLFFFMGQISMPYTRTSFLFYLVLSVAFFYLMVSPAFFSLTLTGMYGVASPILSGYYYAKCWLDARTYVLKTSNQIPSLCKIMNFAYFGPRHFNVLIYSFRAPDIAAVGTFFNLLVAIKNKT